MRKEKKSCKRRKEIKKAKQKLNKSQDYNCNKFQTKDRLNSSAAAEDINENKPFEEKPNNENITKNEEPIMMTENETEALFESIGERFMKAQEKLNADLKKSIKDTLGEITENYEEKNK